MIGPIRRTGRTRRPRRTRLVALGLLLAALPVACNGVGAAVASGGVSLIFVGASPGSVLLDKDAALSGQKLKDLVEDPIVLDAVTPQVDRCAVLGGDVKRKIKVRLAARSEPAGAADLQVEIGLLRATGEFEVLDEFTLASLPSTSTVFEEKIELAGEKGPDTFSGDCLRFRFTNTDPAAGTVTIDPAESEIKIHVKKERGLDLFLFGDNGRPLLRETLPNAAGIGDFEVDAGGIGAAGFAAQTTAAPYILDGTATGATLPPDECVLTIPEKGKMDHVLFARCSTPNGTAEFELRVIVTDFDSGAETVIGTAGPFTVGEQQELVEGEFGARKEAVVDVQRPPAGSNTPPATPISLEIENLGPDSLEILADPGNPDGSSTIHLPGFLLTGTFAHGDARLTQPKPKP